MIHGSTEAEILEYLVQPLEDIFGEIPEGVVRWCLRAMKMYNADYLLKVSNHVIQNSEWSPKPATIIKAIKEIGYVSPFRKVITKDNLDDFR